MVDAKRPRAKAPISPRRGRSEPPTLPSTTMEESIDVDFGVTLPSMRRAEPLSESPRSDSPPVALTRGVEMLVVDDASVPDDAQKPWRAGEVWTKRRIYGLDATFTCVEVLDRESGRLDLTHDMIGARLGGGRLRHNDTVRFSYPLPLPGMEAMFVKGTKQGFTSPLERMVVRIRMVHMSEGRAIPSWEAIVDRDSLKA